MLKYIIALFVLAVDTLRIRERIAAQLRPRRKWNPVQGALLTDPPCPGAVHMAVCSYGTPTACTSPLVQVIPSAERRMR
jgi:hypothetical protein